MLKSSTYSISEEILNTISHGIGALLSVAALTVLVTLAALTQDALHITSFAIYGTSLVLLFLASTLYHAAFSERFKKLFKLFDHCAIYLLIAGTYTPLMLITLHGAFGYSMLALIWTLAALGIWFKIRFAHRFKLLSVATYLGMGAIALAMISRLQAQLSSTAFNLLATGGAIYAIGVIFYLLKRVPYTHAIWHLFVLAGAGCHFFLMLNIF